MSVKKLEKLFNLLNLKELSANEEFVSLVMDLGHSIKLVEDDGILILSDNKTYQGKSKDFKTNNVISFNHVFTQSRDKDSVGKIRYKHKATKFK